MRRQVEIRLGIVTYSGPVYTVTGRGSMWVFAWRSYPLGPAAPVAYINSDYGFEFHGHGPESLTYNDYWNGWPRY